MYMYYKSRRNKTRRRNVAKARGTAQSRAAKQRAEEAKQHRRSKSSPKMIKPGKLPGHIEGALIHTGVVVHGSAVGTKDKRTAALEDFHIDALSKSALGKQRRSEHPDQPTKQAFIKKNTRRTGRGKRRKTRRNAKK